MPDAVLPEPGPVPPAAPVASGLVAVALGALAQALGPEHLDQPEAAWLRAQLPAGALGDALAAAQEDPDEADMPLVGLARSLGLGAGELLAVALAIAVETEPGLGRTLAWLQAPVGDARPTLGLLVTALASVAPCEVHELASGAAMRTGLLALVPGGGPLPERAVAVPQHLLLAARGTAVEIDGASAGGPVQPIPLPPSLLGAAGRQALALSAAPGRTLVVRSGQPDEAVAVATAVVAALGASPLLISNPDLPGLVPWLLLSGLVPVVRLHLGPSERRRLPRLHGWSGPVLVACGPEGTIEPAQGSPVYWSVPVPPAAERLGLWHHAIGDGELAADLALRHRHGAGRIAELGRLARHAAAVAGRRSPTHDDLLDAAWQGDGGGLGSLAHPLPDRIPDESLVLTGPLRTELSLLLARCRQREALAEGLGIAATTRYRTGVRALFVGPSGTGKTLAAGWLATHLGLPLYRVDMASVISKYIGETEKNLAELLARAEVAEVVLLFDEADSLFGKRTDVRQSTDRFANSQTNYLLQRIESYDGIVLLTSNSRSRFDPAFSRRLDMVLDFPPPGPDERRALWQVHLGNGHDLEPRDVNRLAASCDLAGGHVRNAVLAAAVLAREAGRTLTWEDVVQGVALECRKLGRPLPAGLERRS